MKISPNAVRDSVKNVLDFLIEAELALYANEVSISGSRVSFHLIDQDVLFLTTRKHPTVEQYLAWVSAGAYSAVLYDGSLLQVTYNIEGQEISGHRLAYVPCPFEIDIELLAAGEPLADLVELYRDGDALLRSPIRFDYDPVSAKPGHPAAHMTINGTECRIACAAPVHILRFADFVFRHFYAPFWHAHYPFFEAAAWRHLGPSTLTDEDRYSPHMAWDLTATESQVVA